MCTLQGLQWLKIPINAPSDPKVFALAEDFGCDQMTAFGYITALALATASNAPDGELTQYSDAALAKFCGISGKKKAEKFITSLKKCGIIFEKNDKISENFIKKVYFYDWERIRETAVDVAETRKRERDKKRKQREKQKTEADEETECVPQGQSEDVPMGVPCIDKIREYNIKEDNIIYPISSNQSSKKYDADAIDEMIKKNIDFNILKLDYADGVLENLVGIIVDTICGTTPTFTISGNDISRDVVRERFLRLDGDHIRYVIDCFNKNSTKVGNVKAYLTACLFNAPITISSYYTAEVNHDMNERKET